jgi:hypothetical protein
VSAIVSTYVNGDLYVVDGGNLVRFVSGKDEAGTQGPARQPDAPEAQLRLRLRRGAVPGGPAPRRGVYAFDKTSGRLIAIDKLDGIGRSTAPAGSPTGPTSAGCTSWSDPRTARHPRLAVARRRHQAILAVPDEAPTALQPAPSPSGGIKATPKPSKKP